MDTQCSIVSILGFPQKCRRSVIWLKLRSINPPSASLHPRASTGIGCFVFLDSAFALIYYQIVAIRVKWRSSANVVASRRFEKENAYHPVDVRRSKTPYIAESVPPKTTTLEGYNGAQWFQNWGITLRFSLPRTFSFSAFYCNSIASMKDVKVLRT